ncbi:YbaK/EbsC family protein [Shumkonia mesophila]|uniref:YbaK/EbsC family protein n=1 Tax=Shumkonia mesophila TaxID=2838854 RepID=UPI002934A28E|nr:YbaK/EbsC family protein [Shumkonia mesophila]
MSLFGGGGVKAVRRALVAAGSAAQVVRLPRWAATPEDRAAALGASRGAIVQSLVFIVGERPGVVLVAGDRVCRAEALPRTLNLEGEVRPAEASETERATGFAAGGVAPIALAQGLPIAIDVSLKRFATLYVPAGDGRHVFAVTADELKRLTGGIVSYAVTDGEPHHPARPMQRPFDRVDGLL